MTQDMSKEQANGLLEHMRAMETLLQCKCGSDNLQEQMDEQTRLGDGKFELMDMLLELSCAQERLRRAEKHFEEALRVVLK